jgi:ankyrin repeat protein
MSLQSCDFGSMHRWVRDDEMTCAPEENRMFLAHSFSEFARGCSIPFDYLTTLEEIEMFRAVELFDHVGLEALLDSGGDVNMLNERRAPLLLIACKAQNYRAVEVLLKRGANPNKPDAKGMTCLRWAASGGEQDLVALLLSYGAFRHLPNDPSTTVLNSIFPPPSQRMRMLLLGK